ncbi:MAG: peptide-methionine (R)-S-oxide reductase MsrB, partial [Candidatus Omnitrophota bacterium]
YNIPGIPHTDDAQLRRKFPMRMNNRRYCLISALVFFACSGVYAADQFRSAPKVQIYDAGKKDFVFRDKVQKTDAQWRRDLPAEIYVITRNRGTELAFTGKYWNNHEKGLYRCVCCGIDLFASEAKFDSGAGWPSFDRPVMETNIIVKEDRSLPEVKMEVMCARCEAHLGYVTGDGATQTRKRYLINSAAIVFEPSDIQVQ